MDCLSRAVTGVFRSIWHLPLLLYGYIHWFDIFIFSFAFQLLIAWVFIEAGKCPGSDAASLRFQPYGIIHISDVQVQGIHYVYCAVHNSYYPVCARVDLEFAVQTRG